MVETGEGGKSPGGLDDRTAIAGIGREGDQHAALFVTFEATTAEPNGGGGEWFVFFIEDRDHFSFFQGQVDIPDGVIPTVVDVDPGGIK